MNWFPLASFEAIPKAHADAALKSWGHWLEDCDRPFGVQSYGLMMGFDLIAVAVSASTVGVTCGGWPRGRVVELARLCAEPSNRWATRVALRLWREIAPQCWADRYKVQIDAVVSYQDLTRHTGDIYRFDGWTKVKEVPGSTGGGTWSNTRQKREPRAVWVYVLGQHSHAERKRIALERAA